MEAIAKQLEGQWERREKEKKDLRSLHEKDLQDDLDYRMAVERQKAAGEGEKDPPG